MTQAATSLWPAALLGLAGCVIFAPIDDVRPSPPTHEAESAKATSQAADGGGAVRSMSDDEAGTAQAACLRVDNARCDPVSRCGCRPGFLCEFDEGDSDAGAVGEARCVEGKSGDRGLNQRCERTSDCGPALICSVSGLCSRYCTSQPSDCGDSGKCLFHVDSHRALIPGSGACYWYCDPLDSDACGEGQCRASDGHDDIKRAACGGTHSQSRGPGEACDSGDACGRGLDCALFGPQVCVRYCREDKDCEATEQCRMASLLGEQGESIGQCLAPCNDATLPPAAGWNEGPVWSQRSLAADCTKSCPNAGDYDCYRLHCPDGMRYGRCLDATKLALASASGGACRDAYISATCSARSEHEGRNLVLRSCVDAHPELDKQAHAACVTDH